MKFILFLVATILTINVTAQLKSSAPVCPAFTVDVLGGNVNKIHPRSTLAEVVKTFPCHTELVEKDSIECTRVSFKDKGITFFPGRNYIEIQSNFKGTLKPALMGANRGSLFTTLGHPRMKDANWDAYQTVFGTLVLYYNAAGKINKIQMSSRSTDTMKLCE